MSKPNQKSQRSRWFAGNRGPLRAFNPTGILLGASLVFGGVLVGCGQGRSDSPEGYSKESFQDESGVEVVVHRGPFSSLEHRWWMSPNPSTTLSDSSNHMPPGEVLYGIRNAVRLTNGGLVAVYAQGRQVVFWSEGWDVLRIVKTGEGPVSMGLASAVFRNPAGGAVIWDPLRNQAFFMAADGGYLGAVTIEGGLAGTSGLQGVLAGGRFVMITRVPFREGSGRVEARDRFQITLLEDDGSVLLTVDDFEGPLLQRVSPGFYSRRHFEYDPLVHVSDNEIFVFDGDRGEIRVFDSNGQRIRVLRRENPERVITRERRETHIRGLEAALVEMELPEEAFNQMRQREWPEEEGSLIRAIVAPEGRILVAEPGTCGTAHYCWNIYGPSGDFEGAIDMAIETFPMFMGEREVGVLVLGQHGEGEIQIFDIERR